MKPFFIFTAVFFLAGGLFSIHAQDMIILKNGDEIKAKVLEISPSEIKYKRFDNLEGPTVTIPAANVVMVQYENGTREIIGTETKNSPSGSSKAQKAVDNKWVGFGLNFVLGLGIGSYVQGDTNGGTISLIGDILGWGMVIIGAANPIIGEKQEYIGSNSYSVPTVEINPLVYIGTAALAGVRIFELIRPFTYANKYKYSVAFSPVVDTNGQFALATAVNLKF